ncbi:MAG: hypothetical protein ACYCU7_07010 [Acidimicrobiales bacterium]
MTVTGPGWSTPGLQIIAGRFPLAVEQHVSHMTDLLVPGATTVTPHGRYYSLHALAAVEAEARDLNVPETLELLRRMELVMGAISVLHEAHPEFHGDFPSPHGADAIGPRLRADGNLDVAGLSQPGDRGYVVAQSGFWGPYAGSEDVLGIVTTGKAPRPGPRCDAVAVRGGLSDLLELARRDQVAREELEGVTHLCLCAGRAAPDGVWLRTLLCAPAAESKADRTRRATTQLLARVARNGVADFGGSFVSAVGFGAFIETDLVAGALEEAQAWRGVVLRRFSVGAWRRLWSWLVDQVIGLVSSEELTDAFADQLPAVSVASFLAGLPPTRGGDGSPAPAEQQLRERDAPVPEVELAVLATGARRSSELEGRVGEAFRGRPVELGPEWMARRLDTHEGQGLRDFGRDLVATLLERARRIALSKMSQRRDKKLPTRLHDKGGLLWRTSREGAGDVGLRIDQLGTVLAEAGVFAWQGDRWHPTPEGLACLD